MLSVLDSINAAYRSSPARLLIYLLLTTSVFAQSDTGLINGSVRDDSGLPAQAHITLIANGVTRHAFSATNGDFVFITLPRGAYTLCGQILPTGAKKEDPAVNSCDWMEPSSTLKLTLAKDEHRTGLRLNLKRGRLITVRVNDPGKVLSAVSSNRSSAEVSVLVAGPSGLMNRVPVLNTDSGGRNHAIVIAYDTPHRLFVHSDAFSLTDANSQPRVAGAPTGIQVAHGDADVVVVVNVSGKGK